MMKTAILFAILYYLDKTNSQSLLHCLGFCDKQSSDQLLDGGCIISFEPLDIQSCRYFIKIKNKTIVADRIELSFLPELILRVLSSYLFIDIF